MIGRRVNLFRCLVDVGVLAATLKRRVGSRPPKSIIQLIEAQTFIERPVSLMSRSRLAFRLYIIETIVEKLVHDANCL